MKTFIFINPNADTPDDALVISAANPNRKPIPAICVGNIVTYHVYLVDGTGGYDAESGDNTYTLKLGIGIPGQTPIAQVTSFTQITGTDFTGVNGWKMTLDADEAAVVAFMQGVRERTDAVWELEITDDNANVRTVVQQKISILSTIQ